MTLMNSQKLDLMWSMSYWSQFDGLICGIENKANTKKGIKINIMRKTAVCPTTCNPL